jgi:thioredoxin 2
MSSRVSTCPACGAKNRVPVGGKGRPQCASCHAALPWLVDATDADFAAATQTGQLVLVDLWAPWCGPCRTVAPVLERLSVAYAGRVKVVKVNVDDNRRTAVRFDAQSIPTLVILKDGRTVDRVVGAQPEPVLRTRIDRLLAVN